MAGSARIDELKRKFDENPRRYFAPLANEYRKAGDLEQAIAICRTHLPQQPGHMSGHVVFGQALFDAGDLDEAQTVFETALTLDPENLIALRHLGDIAQMRGDSPGAVSWYQRVLDADPRNEEISGRLRDLENAAEPATRPTPATHDSLGWGDINPERVARQSPAWSAPALGETFVAPAPPATELGMPPPPVNAVSETPTSFSPVPETRDPLSPPEPAGFAGAFHPTTSDATGADEQAVEQFAALDLDHVGGEREGAEFDARWWTEGDAGRRLLDEETGTFGDVDATEPPPDEFEPLDLEPDFGQAREPVSAGEAGDDQSTDAPERTSEMDALFGDMVIGAEPDSEAVADTDAEGTSLVIESMEFAPPPAGEIPLMSERAETAFDAFAGAASAEPEEGAADRSPRDVDVLAREYAAEDASTEAQQPFASHAGERPMPAGERAEATTPRSSAAQTPSTFVTETMAELYVRQGFHDEALGIYRQLVVRAPGDVGLLERMERVERARDAALARAATASREGAGPSVRSFFAGLARRAVTPSVGAGGLDSLFANAAVAPHDEQAAAALAGMFGGSDVPKDGPGANESVSGGRPSRPAATELSLDEVFRDPARRRTPARGSPGLSFDQFFAESAESGSAPAPTTPAGGEPAADDSSDLEQFNAWLDGLKKK